MKVVYLNPIGQMGGAEVALLNLLASVREAQPLWKLHLVVAGDGPLAAKATKLGVSANVLRFPASLARLGDASSGGPAGSRVGRLTLLCQLLLATPGIAVYVLSLRRELRKFKPDIIHTNGFKMHLLGAMTKPRNVPLIWHIHDYVRPRPFVGSLMKLLRRRCSIALANSKSVERDIKSALGADLAVKPLYDAVDTTVFCPDGPSLDLDSLSGLLPADQSTVRIGMLATLARWKGHETFLRAISLLPGELAVRGYVIGGALYQTNGSQYSINELRALAEEFAISDRVGFTGFIDEPAAAMRFLDIVVHASTEPEPFGLVIAEGMACGRAVIASASGGALEIFEPGIDAVAHPPGDAVRLAEQIKLLATDLDLRKRLSAEARATIEHRFSLQTLATELVPIYEETCSVRHGPAAPNHLELEYQTAGWRWRSWHVGMLVAGLLIRIAYGLTLDKESSFGGLDGKEYFAYAQSLLSLRWDAYPRYFNSIRPPFYPIFLTPFLAINNQIVWPIQLAQSFIGVVQALVLAHIAGRWRGQRAGNWAFAIALFHPFLIFYCGFLLTETVFIALLWGGIACLQRFNEPQSKNPIRWLTYGGLALALGCLTRAPLQLFLPVAALWIGWRTLRNSDWVCALKRAAYFTMIVSALLLPFMVRNYLVHGEVSLAPGGGPEMFAWGNSPEYLSLNEAQTKDEYYRIQDHLTTRLLVSSRASLEPWLQEVRDFRRSRPADWWRLQWYKFKHFWTPWLNPLIFPRTNFLISVIANTPLFLLAGVELFRRKAKRDSFLVLLLGLIAVGYLVGGFLFHVQVRYRIPYVDVTFILLTASLLGSLVPKRVSEWKLTRPLARAEA